MTDRISTEQQRINRRTYGIGYDLAFGTATKDRVESIPEVTKDTHKTELSGKSGELEAAKQTIEKMRELLRVAECPDGNCDKNGAAGILHGDGDWEIYQCQWCHERKAIGSKS